MAFITKVIPKTFQFDLSSFPFQESAKRLTSSDIIEFAPHITLTNSDFRFIIGEQLQEIGIDPGPILIESEAKNTAAAILAASIFEYSKDENAVLLVAPSDHVISDTEYFHQTINVGLSHVENRKMVTFGIKPTHPEIGYGYLELSTDFFDGYGTSELRSFVETQSEPSGANVGGGSLSLERWNIFIPRSRHDQRIQELCSQNFGACYACCK